LELCKITYRTVRSHRIYRPNRADRAYRDKIKFEGIRTNDISNLILRANSNPGKFNEISTAPIVQIVQIVPIAHIAQIASRIFKFF
jgi:hypothetical protein